MTWLIRMGVLNAFTGAAARDPSIHKADSPRPPPSAEDIAADRDIALSGLGGTRHASMDYRSQQLAKFDALDRHQAAVRKAAEDRDASLCKEILVLPSEERKRQTAAKGVAKPKATKPKNPGDDDQDGGNTPPSASAPVRDTKVKPGTSNVTHKPSDEGVYAPRDGRTVTTQHTVNRKRSAYQKSVVKTDQRAGPLDLTDWRSWRVRVA